MAALSPCLILLLLRLDTRCYAIASPCFSPMLMLFSRRYAFTLSICHAIHLLLFDYCCHDAYDMLLLPLRQMPRFRRRRYASMFRRYALPATPLLPCLPLLHDAFDFRYATLMMPLCCFSPCHAAAAILIAALLPLLLPLMPLLSLFAAAIISAFFFSFFRHYDTYTPRMR